MTITYPSVESGNSSIPEEATLHQIRFVKQAAEGQEVLSTFADPVPHKAVCILPETVEILDSGGIDILTLSGQTSENLSGNDHLLKWVAEATPSGMAPPIVITIHGAQVIWGCGRSAILAASERVHQFLMAVVDFGYYESQLGKLENEVGESWPLVEGDTPLAHDVSMHDPERFETIGQRLEQTLQRRMRAARLRIHFLRPRAHLTLLANQLVERLREKTHVEDRHESLVSQLEVCERIYEMNSQKISDFKIARQERTLEWVIIVLLAAETILLLINVMWALGV